MAEMEQISEVKTLPHVSAVEDIDLVRFDTVLNAQEMEKDRIVLIPCPSPDPKDPLNWTFIKKATILSVLCAAFFAAAGASSTGQLNLNQQAALYGKTTVQMTYFNSASAIGNSIGGYFWIPLSYKLGRCSVILFAQLGCLASQIWASQMNHSNDYREYLVSRFFAGFFSIACGILAPKFIFDLFFLHQRGRAFTISHVASSLGAVSAPTLSAYISANSSWTIQGTWNIGLLALSSLLIVCFLEDTGFDRDDLASNPIKSPSSFQNRVHTFLPGNKVVNLKPVSFRELITIFSMPFKISLAPVVVVLTAFDAVGFGFCLALNALCPVWLQTEKQNGGYGFSVSDNAAFSFIHWIGVFIGLAYGAYCGDRIPLWFAARNGGVWKPEYRLQLLWIPAFIVLPAGLGLVAISLHFHLHWMVLAIGSSLVNIGAFACLPVTVNYICECFRGYELEATQTIHAARPILGSTISFYITPWIKSVGFGWVYGMMALISMCSFGFVVILMKYGHTIRECVGLGASEEGETLVKAETSTSDI